MGIRGQNEHPMRFAVTASTLSGLLVVLVSGATGKVLKSDSFMRSALPWALAAIAWAILAASSLIWARWKAQQGRQRRVFLMIPAFAQKHWVAELIRYMHDDLERRGYDMVLKIPDRDYSGSCQIRLLEDILRRRSEYAGGLIVANEVDQIQEGLVGFCARAMMPIVFVDVEPFRDIGNYPPHTAFVGYAADKIGELAAGWVVGYLRRKHIRRPRVLVISGDAHHERERVFCRLLGSAIRDAQITQDSAEFDRMRAREVARKHLRRFISAGQQPHVIFCTNDEMALGVVDALLFSDATAAGDVVVVGVDGTPQTRALIDAGPSPLRATVIQDASKVAETAAELMVKMIRNENIPTCTRLTGDVLARD